MLPREILNNCVALDCIFIENKIEYDIIFQGLPPMYSMIFLEPPFFLQARK